MKKPRALRQSKSLTTKRPRPKTHGQQRPKLGKRKRRF